MKKSEYVAALRELADYVDAREWPEKIQGWLGPQDTFDAPNLVFSTKNKTEFGLLCASLGKFEKTRNEYTTGATATLESGVKILVTANRDVVCRKIVVGKKTVPATEERIEAQPEREIDVVEWECPESFINLGKEEATNV
jgi:hypothetical protein